MKKTKTDKVSDNRIIIKKKHSILEAVGTVFSTILVLIIIVCTSFSALFFIYRDTPENIFIFNYAVVFSKESNTVSVRLVGKTQPDLLENGDGVVYFEDGQYKFANMMLLPESGKRAYFSAPELDVQVAAEENYVGEVIAVWQQKLPFGSIM